MMGAPLKLGDLLWMAVQCHSMLSTSDASDVGKVV